MTPGLESRFQFKGEYQEIFEIPYYGDETPPIALLDKTDISISDLWYPADLGISGVIGDISGGNRKLYDLCSYGYNLISINNPESATGLIFTPNNLSDTDFSNVSIFDKSSEYPSADHSYLELISPCSRRDLCLQSSVSAD